jgi:RNA polymerase sigma factor (sigma-70 family)
MARRTWRVLLGFVGPAPGDWTDRSLLERFAEAGEETAFAELIRRHGPMVLAACRRVLSCEADAEDAFQATFCVLARKASSGGWRHSIGNWLYTVAYRIACRARARTARHRQQERAAAAMRAAAAPVEMDPQLGCLLDQELARLPEKYRAPLVLCYLEGQSNEEAARTLGWPKGTVQGRLARARELLRMRLTRRGIALSIGAAGMLETDMALAAVSGNLLHATVHTALQFAARQTTPDAVPASVAVLAEGALHSMQLTKVRVAILGALAVGMLSGAGFLTVCHGGRVPMPQAMAAPPSVISDRRPAIVGPVSVQALAVPLPPEETEKAAAVTAFSAGIVDRTDGVVYAVNTAGGIDALDLQTGKLQWQTQKRIVCWHLTIDGKKLFVRVRQRKSEVKIAVLDITKNGKTLLTSEALSFPDWVQPYRWFDHYSVGQAPAGIPYSRDSRQFEARERVDNGQLLIDWKARLKRVTFSEGRIISEKEGRGDFVVDLNTGKVKATFSEGRVQFDGKTMDQIHQAQVGDYELRVQEDQSGGGFVSGHTRTLIVTDKGSDKKLWQHPIKSYLVFEP